jgi:type IV secretory pathway VirB3-like protein
VYCVLCIVYCVLCIVYCVLCIVYCVLCIVYCVCVCVFFRFFRFVSVVFCFVSVEPKHRNTLFRYRTETNSLFRIVSKLVSVPVSVVSNRN